MGISTCLQGERVKKREVAPTRDTFKKRVLSDPRHPKTLSKPEQTKVLDQQSPLSPHRETYGLESGQSPSQTSCAPGPRDGSTVT